MRLVELILLLLTALIPLGELGRIPFVFPNSYVYPNDFLIPLLIVVWLIYRLSITKSLVLPKLTLPILAVVVVSGISLLGAKPDLSTSQFVVSALYLVRLIEYLAVYFVAWDIFRRTDRINWWVKVLLAVAFGLSLTGFVQYVVLPDFSFAAQYGWDPHVGRLLGTFFDPNFIGGFLSLALALTLAKLTGTGPKYKLTLSILTAIFFVAIVLTFSRSAYLALAGVVLVIGVFRTRWLIIASAVAFAVAILLVPRIQERLTEGIDPGESASFRLTSWGNAISVWQSSPIIGVGYNSYRYAQDRLGLVNLDASGNAGAGADSSVLFILATTGLVGILAWGNLLLHILIIAWRNLTRGRDLGLALIASLVALGLHSQFVNSFFLIWIILWFWILVALTEADELDH